MTELYKKYGGVFIPINLTLEEVNEYLDELKEIQKRLDKENENERNQFNKE